MATRRPEPRSAPEVSFGAQQLSTRSQQRHSNRKGRQRPSDAMYIGFSQRMCLAPTRFTDYPIPRSVQPKLQACRACIRGTPWRRMFFCLYRVVARSHKLTAYGLEPRRVHPGACRQRLPIRGSPPPARWSKSASTAFDEPAFCPGKFKNPDRPSQVTPTTPLGGVWVFCANIATVRALGAGRVLIGGYGFRRQEGRFLCPASRFLAPAANLLRMSSKVCSTSFLSRAIVSQLPAGLPPARCLRLDRICEISLNTPQNKQRKNNLN